MEMMRERARVSLVEMCEENLEDFTSLCVAGHRGLEEAHARQVDYLRRALKGGMSGYVAYDEDGQVAGFCEYLPVGIGPAALAFPSGWKWAAESRPPMFMPCFWVRDDLWGRGVGRVLMEAATTACADCPCIVVVGYDSSEHMQHTFFEHFGFKVVESRGMLRLMVRPGPRVAGDPERLHQVMGVRWSVVGPRPREAGEWPDGPGRGGQALPHELVIFTNDACPFNWVSVQRARAVAHEMRDTVRLDVFDYEKDGSCRGFSVDGAVFLDGRLVSHDPVSEDFLRMLLRQPLDSIPGM